MTKLFKSMTYVLMALVVGSGSVTAAEDSRPRWAMPNDISMLKSDLADWLELDESAVRDKARELEVDELETVAERWVALHMATKDAAHGECAAAVLTVALHRADVGDDPADRITTEGSRDEINLAVRDASFLLALRYQATADEADAAAVRRILLRFAEVVPDWPLWDRQGNRRSQDDERFHQQWDGRGIWGAWFHMDLERAEPVLRAYDLVHDTLSDKDLATIRAGLFDHHVALIERWPMAYTNMIGHQLIGLLHFGLTLPEPAYVHRALEYYEDMAYVSFFPDGFFREAAPSYHTMPALRLQNRIPALVEGYSDPPGYAHPETGRRLDDVNLADRFQRHHERWWRAWDKLTLPNRTTLAVNDSTAGRQAWWTERDLSQTEPRLLGTTGIGVLGHGQDGNQLEAYLLFAGTHGHEHYDVLNLVWWAHGREVFSETNYRPAPGSDSTRQWHTMSAGHNLVVVDEKNQHNRFGGRQRNLTDDDALRGMRTWQYRNRSMNHGNLLLFDPTADEIQVMEAEGERAYYGVASFYRRTLAMVALGEGDGYLLDIFRVRGGQVQDYMLHGGLDEQYSVEHTVQTEQTESTEHKYIQLNEKGWATPPASFTFRYDDGLRTTSHIVGPTAQDGMGKDGSQFMVGHAPAMRRVGDAPFVILRRRGGDELARPGGEHTFVLVHEAHQGESHIASAELLPVQSDDDEAMAVRVTLINGREDIFLSTLDDGTITLDDGTVFRGRSGHMQRDADDRQAVRIFDGYKLLTPDDEGLDGLEPLRGRVLETRRVEAGDENEGIVVEGDLPTDGSLTGRTIHVDLGGEVTWSYQIQGIEREANERSVVWIEHEPGFEIREDGALAKMLFYPGWGIRAAVTFRVPVGGTWQSTFD